MSTMYCGDNCNHTGPHHYPPEGVVAQMVALAHVHDWRAGPFLPRVKHSPHSPDDPESLLLICSCGEVRRVRVPRKVEP